MHAHQWRTADLSLTRKDLGSVSWKQSTASRARYTIAIHDADEDGPRFAACSCRLKRELSYIAHGAPRMTTGNDFLRYLRDHFLRAQPAFLPEPSPPAKSRDACRRLSFWREPAVPLGETRIMVPNPVERSCQREPSKTVNSRGST